MTRVSIAIPRLSREPTAVRAPAPPAQRYFLGEASEGAVEAPSDYLGLSSVWQADLAPSPGAGIDDRVEQAFRQLLHPRDVGDLH